MALVLGVDSSTQSTKVEARDIDSGALAAASRSEHPATEPPVSEQHPHAWWDALVEAVHALGDLRHGVVAVSIAGQQHGLVLVDGSDAVVRPAKLWNDTTSAPLADELVSALGADTWARACGSVPVASFTVTKLAWAARHEPDALAAAVKVMLPHDYLTWRLTGNHVTDRGDASGTGWYDPVTGEYRADLLDAAVGDAISVDALPAVLGPRAVAGQLTVSSAAALGLPAGLVVGPGTGDNMAAALGLGLGRGDVALSLGTSGTVYAVSDVGTHDSAGAVAGFADATGGFLPLVCTLNATKVTDTVAGWLGTDVAGLSDLALAAAADPPPPVLIPYFDGERTPNVPGAAGLLHGLRTGTTREQLALAAHDGVLCGLFEGFDALAAAGVATNGRLHLIGGGARSRAYRQRAADIHGGPVHVPDALEVVATGACLQAAMVSSGRDAADLASAWDLGGGVTVEPAADASDVREAYARARALAVIG